MWNILPPNQLQVNKIYLYNQNTIWLEIDDSNWKLDTKLLETEFAKIETKSSVLSSNKLP